MVTQETFSSAAWHVFQSALAKAHWDLQGFNRLFNRHLLEVSNLAYTQNNSAERCALIGGGAGGLSLNLSSQTRGAAVGQPGTFNLQKPPPGKRKHWVLHTGAHIFLYIATPLTTMTVNLLSRHYHFLPRVCHVWAQVLWEKATEREAGDVLRAAFRGECSIRTSCVFQLMTSHGYWEQGNEAIKKPRFWEEFFLLRVSASLVHSSFATPARSSTWQLCTHVLIIFVWPCSQVPFHWFIFLLAG